MNTNIKVQYVKQQQCHSYTWISFKIPQNYSIFEKKSIETSKKAMDSLPDDMILTIFEYLDEKCLENAVNVCER